MPETRRIKLTKGQVTIVDAADYEWLNQWKWHTHSSGRIGGPRRFYAIRRPLKSEPNQHMIRMHRLIMSDPEDMQIDHRDHNGLNNVRANLRVATRSQNAFNARKQDGCSSVYKGVTLDKVNNKWRAQIRVDASNRCLGRYAFEEDAAAAYNDAALQAFGDFATLNQIGRGACV